MSDTFSNLTYHLVFSTKGRLPLISRSIRDDLFSYVGGIVKGLGGSALAIGGMPDHVHLLVSLPTSVSVADSVRVVKANSSKWANKKITNSRFGWQSGYGAFSVSRSMVSVVAAYVGNQERHHRQRSFANELAVLIRLHGLDSEIVYPGKSVAPPGLGR